MKIKTEYGEFIRCIRKEGSHLGDTLVNVNVRKEHIMRIENGQVFDLSNTWCGKLMTAEDFQKDSPEKEAEAAFLRGDKHEEYDEGQEKE